MSLPNQQGHRFQKRGLGTFPGALILVLSLAAVVLVSACLLLTFAGESARQLARNTLLLSLATCVISLPVATAITVCLVRTDLPGRKVCFWLIASLLFVPLYLQASAWDAGFGLLGWYTLIQDGMRKPLLDGWTAAIWIHAVYAIPWAVVIISIGLAKASRHLEELALLDATGCRVFWSVTLPGVAPAILAAGLWVTVMTAGEMTVTDMYRIRTYAEEIYLNLPMALPVSQINGTGDTPMAPVGSVQMFEQVCMLAILVACGLLVLPRILPRYDMRPTAQSPLFRLGRWRLATYVFLGIVMAVLIFVPVGNLIYKAGLVFLPTESGVRRDWYFGHFLTVLSSTPWKYRSEFYWTTLIGIASTSVVLILAIPLAWWSRTKRFGATVCASFMCAVGFAAPGPLVGIFVESMLNREHGEFFNWLYDYTVLAPVVAVSIKSLPLAVIACWWLFRTVPDRLLERAEIDGMSGLRQLFSIGIKGHMIPLAGIALLTFGISTGDLAASLLVLPAGMETIQRRVFGFVHSGVDDQVAAICLVQWMVVLGCFTLAMAAFSGKSFFRPVTT